MCYNLLYLKAEQECAENWKKFFAYFCYKTLAKIMIFCYNDSIRTFVCYADRQMSQKGLYALTEKSLQVRGEKSCQTDYFRA